MKPSKDLDEQKLDEILEDFYDGDIRQSDMGKAKQAILDWHNKQTLELLDRLAAQRGILSDPVHGEKSIPLSAIKAERAKLKEIDDETQTMF